MTVSIQPQTMPIDPTCASCHNWQPEPDHAPKQLIIQRPGREKITILLCPRCLNQLRSELS